MKRNIITVEIMPSTDIKDAVIATKKYLDVLFNNSIQFDFNGINIVVHPNSDVYEIINSYYKERQK